MTNKKLTLKHFFLKRFIPLLFTGIIFCAIATLALKVVIVDLLYVPAAASEFDDICDYIESRNIEGTDEDILKFYINLYANTFYFEEKNFDRSVIAVDNETGEIISTSEFAIFALSRENSDGKPYVYKCTNKEVTEFCSQYSDAPITIDFDRIYVKDGEFVPDKVVITRITDDELGSPIGVLAEKNFTPDDVSGYEVVDSATLKIFAGTPTQSALLAEMKERLNGKTEYVIGDELFNIYAEHDNSIFYGDKIVKSGEKEYRICTIVDLDFKKAYFSLFMIDYIITLVIIVLISFIWGKIAYEKYSAKYDMDEARKNMVNALAHDLKSPLMAISGYAENLSENIHPEKKNYYAEAIMDNAAYMNSIITSTLELSKAEKAGTIKKEDTDIIALVNSLYEKYRPEAEGRGVKFSVKGNAIVKADKALMTQALENLITNAVKFTPDGGEINITADGKKITVANTYENGEELKKLDLTAPFVKGSSSRTNRTGTGIGLAIAKTACLRQKFKLEIMPEENIFKAIIKF